MVPRELLPLAITLVLLYVVAVIFSVALFLYMRRGLKNKEREAKQRMYELAILKEISDRTGYSLNIKKILDVITGSLGQFIEYSAVSYMLLDPAKIFFKADLKHSVAPRFVKDVRGRMLESLSALLGRDLAGVPVEEVVEGAIAFEDAKGEVLSYFNIPIVISGKLVGVLTVAHTESGLYKEEEMALLYKILAQASHAMTQLEEVIRIEQGKIAAMLESMVEGVVMTDRDYRIVAANPTAKKIIGKEGVAMPTIFDFIDAFHGVFDVKEKLEEAIKLDKVVSLSDVLFNNRYYQVLVSPVKSSSGLAQGQILGGAIIFHDVTHEKEAEKMKSDFTAMMVHELRSPLGNIKKIGELFRTIKSVPDLGTAHEYAEMVYESSASMLDLVNDLLDVAKLESGKFELVRQSGSIKDLIAGCVKFFEPVAQEKTVTITSKIGAGVPEKLSLDVDRIKQVLNNLITNALKYTSGGDTITISAFVHVQGASLSIESGVEFFWPNKEEEEKAKNIPNSLVVTIADTGTGIAPENIHKLWDKLTQFEFSVRSRGEHGGTGLGLIVVKGIVEAHGGTVGLGSRFGTGSTAYFTIPL